MHVRQFETWVVFILAASCLVTCGFSSSNTNGFKDVYSDLVNAKIRNVHQEIISHKSLNANKLDEKQELKCFEDAKKKTGVVENAGNDFYMVRSVINGDGKITGSSVSVLSKETIDLSKSQVSGMSFENRLDKASKNKHKPRPNYQTNFDETMPPLMDEPSKGKYVEMLQNCTVKFLFKLFVSKKHILLFQ